MVVAGMVVAAALSVQGVVESVNRRLADADASVGLSRFVGYPKGADKDEFTPNPRFWAKGVDFSCASPWNSAGGAQRAGTLISKRHILFAKHFPLWKGVRILFVGADGGVCPCSIEKTVGVSDSDIMVGLLNAEVTPNILPAKILPSDAEKHIGKGEGFPVVTFNQREELLLAEMNFTPTNWPWVKWQSCRASTNSNWRAFHREIVGGDSGNPAFMLIGDQPILLSCLKKGGYGAGPSLHYYRREVQKAMDELCPGYWLEEFDFKSLNGRLK